MASQSPEATFSLDIVPQMLKEFSLTERDINKAADDAVILSLGLNFYLSLGLCLGLSESDIAAVKKDNHSDQDRVVALFWKWRERKGSDATYLSLLEALIKYENKEAAEKLCRKIHASSRSTKSSFKTQSSLSYQSRDRRPIRHPINQSQKKVWCEKNTGNKAWKIFDQYHDRLVNILRCDIALCDSVFKILADNFLIGIAEKDVIQQLTNLDIKSKAIMRHVSIFISKARNPIRAFAKFSAIIQEFENFREIYNEIQLKASKVEIVIKSSFVLVKNSPSLTSNRESSANFSDAVYDDSLLTPPIKKYSRHLKSCYKKEKPDQKWSLENIPSRLYINLAVVCKNEDYRDSFSNSTIHGTNDDIFCRKKSLSLEELCRIEYGEAVLIEGAPGIGKSMLAFEICSRWVKGEALKKYPLLLLLRLRDRVIKNCESVRELLGCFLKEQSWKDAVVQDIIDNGGEGLIVILEGFDELPEHLTKQDSVFFQFSTVLPCASLVFTSRPSAKHFLRLKVEFELHVEVIGFTHENINEYIQKFCKGNSEHIKTFNQYLDESPKVRDCLYIPINLAIICSIFQQYIMNKEQVPLKGIMTSTKLYEAMIKMLLYRHIKSQTQELVSVDLYNLPHPIQEEFASLCHMAYDGLKNRATELLFYANKDFETLGMMQKEVQVYPGTGDVIAYSFLHLTIQEFLAAYHISQLPRNKIEDIFNRLRHVMKFSTMLCFLSGLTELQSITPRVDDDLYSMTLFHCLYESGNESLTASLFEKKIIQGSSHSSFTLTSGHVHSW
ncbi:PREDICTED: uncharacterized protein LOC109582469 [Amphimedon queenslandica]|uniref:Death domain-containing protein n=1 Tax=Amphimedon queenslandica TaxID=400682 RepID=A0A1X7URK9_AMPQE|nr:PREDICTED: uncharacterized protein LOC109582469 [Amphimedon queenslandica]|eukprot:XP_019852745.1 PREDICTED: uncharacterized protein LOC109582469 [Amphimedon queenslandica]